jgi:hypothetical protein
MPRDIEAFSQELDRQMVGLNSYYKDLIEGKILRQLHIHILQKGAFISYMRSLGKLGGQNKVPRLANDRRIANELKCYIIEGIQ